MAANAANSAERPPDPQTPVGLPPDNVHAGNDLVLWNASNDEWVSKLEAELKRLEAEAAVHPDEGYEGRIDRVRQDIQAVCALPATTVC